MHITQYTMITGEMFPADVIDLQNEQQQQQKNPKQAARFFYSVFFVLFLQIVWTEWARVRTRMSSAFYFLVK